jgi:hypothetical protein
VGTSDEMEQRRKLLESHAVVITEEGPRAVQSKEEVKDIIALHFGISKHNFYVYRNSSEPFVAFFHDTHDRDVVFAAAKLLMAPLILSFMLRTWIGLVIEPSFHIMLDLISKASLTMLGTKTLPRKSCVMKL